MKAKTTKTSKSAEAAATEAGLMTTGMLHRAINAGVPKDDQTGIETVRNRLAALVKRDEVKVRGYFTPSGKGSALGKVKLWGPEALDLVKAYQGGGQGGTLEILGDAA